MNKTVMRLCLTIVGCLMLVAAFLVSGQPMMPKVAAVQQFETRCGWFSNPTPANISLYDRHGEWIIGVQGGYQVEDDWDWPVFAPRQWVRTNGNYGYGCACLSVRVNRGNHTVLAIRSSRGRPLATCRQDPSLRKWQSMLQ